MYMIILSQRDQRWSDVKLGQSKLFMRNFGCTTTCISMLSDYFKGYIDPSGLAHNVNNYTKDGLIVWTKLNLPTMKFVYRHYKRDDKVIIDALKDPNKAVILQVDNGKHWVVALRKTLIGNSYIVADPWTGSKVDVIKTWRNITGMAVFERK